MVKSLNCLISAGPTREWIDPVRFISNPSSGKMGYALASEAHKRNFKVNLVSGLMITSKILENGKVRVVLEYIIQMYLKH